MSKFIFVMFASLFIGLMSCNIGSNKPVEVQTDSIQVIEQVDSVAVDSLQVSGVDSVMVNAGDSI